jgi:alpha-tubulin suppressor-like RCC1 family protein
LFLRQGELTSVRNASLGPGGGCTLVLDPLGNPTLECWGAYTSQAGPVAIDGGVSFSDALGSASPGRAHACGIATRAGALDVECWGQNDHGQLGPMGQPGTPSGIPLPIGLEQPGPIEVVSGGDSACARLADESAKCWGKNDRGQLGAGAGPDSAVPVTVALPAGSLVKAITMGNAHGCALLEDTSVWCWGDNAAGQLGIGLDAGTVALPQPVLTATASGPVPLSFAVDVAAGGRTTCVTRLTDGRAWCFGANDFGQAGQGGGGVVEYASPVAW